MEVRRHDRLTPGQFRTEVLGSDEPVVVTGMLASWGAARWSPSHFAGDGGGSGVGGGGCRGDDALGRAAATIASSAGYARGRAAFRRRDAAGPAWETDCVQREVTVGAFARWVMSAADERRSGDNGVCSGGSASSGGSGAPPRDGWEDDIDADTHWGYLSYARMAELFAANPDVHGEEMIDWRAVGLEGSLGWDTNLWFGTQGAVTQLHSDAYGTNVVAQLFGTKRWTLFPPGTRGLYPTRVPFEESSVFSEVDLASPDASRHPLFASNASARRWVATVRPGDVLFVPRHWWHHVEAVSASISVNCWVPDPERDAAERVREGLVRLLVSELRSWAGARGGEGEGAVAAAAAGPTHWLNPTEEDVPRATVVDLLGRALAAEVAEAGVEPAEPAGAAEGTPLTLDGLLRALTSPPVVAAWRSELGDRLQR